MSALTTPRLHLRELRDSDADFIHRLLNDPSWLRYIGDRGVHSVDDARRYIANGPVAMYAKLGYGLYAVERREDGAVMGLCGLLKRDGLDDADIGFALLPEYAGHGYAREAAAATLESAWHTHALPRVVAITSQQNEASIRLLQSIGLVQRGEVTLPGATEALRLFVIERPR